MIITPEKLAELLQTTGLPVFNTIVRNEEAKPPYIMFIEDEPEIFEADNMNYVISNRYIVEIYDSLKNYDEENKIEELFRNNDIPFKKSGDMWDESEELTVVAYNI